MMGQTSESLNLNLRGAFLSAGLPSPSSLRDATSPKVRGLGSPPSFRFYTLRPAAAKRAVRRCAQTFRLCQGLPLWGSWREAPERASPLPWPLSPSLAGAFGRPRASPAEGRLRLCLAQRTARQRGQARGQLNLNIWRKILWYIVSTLKRNPASMWKPRG